MRKPEKKQQISWHFSYRNQRLNVPVTEDRALLALCSTNEQEPLLPVGPTCSPLPVIYTLLINPVVTNLALQSQRRM